MVSDSSCAKFVTVAFVTGIACGYLLHAQRVRRLQQIASDLGAVTVRQASQRALTTAMTMHKTWLGVFPQALHTLPNGVTKLVLSLGSVVDFEGDAIVNAANEQCLGE
jgi:hypothetical protein